MIYCQNNYNNNTQLYLAILCKRNDQVNNILSKCNKIYNTDVFKDDGK